MDGEKDKKKALESETFDLYESIRPRVEEFLDEWFIVGIRSNVEAVYLWAVSIKVGTGSSLLMTQSKNGRKKTAVSRGAGE